MSTFESLSKESEFVKLDTKRAAALDVLIVHNESLEALDKEKSSLRDFQWLEGKIDEQIKIFISCHKCSSCILYKKWRGHIGRSWL